MFWRILPMRLWGFGLLLMAGLSLAFYLILALGAKSTVTQQLLNREQTLARAQANNITSFFQIFGDSLAVFAQLSSMKSPDSTTMHDMDVFVDQWRNSGLIGGVVLTDKNGVVQLNANILGTSDVGASLADRDYFLWAKNHPTKGEYFVGYPVTSRLGATKGELIVPVAAPVYQKDVFVGVLSASIKLQSLTQRYLALMKVSDATDIYLIDSQGELLYSNSASDTAGSSVLDLFPELNNVLNTTNESKLQTQKHLVAYSPISVGNQNWFLITASPIQNVMSLTAPIYIRQAAILILIALTILLFGVITNRKNQTKRS